ncbi:type A2 lantipeptide [Streptomyces sp. Z26]|uniref:type A2 lantipeptide n=1 Tax=Streptomyces TaxID=1883 RepID=UPI0019D000A9|nr:type A2 lantipeptide [Streptomyces sp. Z26]
MDFTPQVETREIADSELDNVSGGLADGLNLSPITDLDLGVEGIGSIAAPVTGTVGEIIAGL